MMDLMMNVKNGRLLGIKRVRQTWKVRLSPEKNAARIEQMRFCKAVAKLLGSDYKVEFYFNPGGPAVWGETYVKIYASPFLQNKGQEVVEACLSVDFSYMRQWDGKHSGHNLQCTYTRNYLGFVSNVKRLASQPFVRF